MLTSDRKGDVVYRYAAVVVTMTDRDVVDRVGSLVDERVQVVQPSKAGVSKLEQYRVSVRGQRGVVLMRLLRGRMGLRRQKQIDRVLDYELQRPDANASRRARSAAAAAKRQRDAKGRLT